MNYFFFILFLIFGHVFGIEVLHPEGLKCYKLSWKGPDENINDKINCSDKKFENIPCIKPFLASLKPPNLTGKWLEWDSKDKEKYSCSLRPGESCMKYTYNFNDAIVNSSHFCGKMMDTVTPIESGCFTQETGGYIIETCACQSSPFDNVPCNISSKNSYSLLGIILFSLYIIFNIY